MFFSNLGLGTPLVALPPRGFFLESAQLGTLNLWIHGVIPIPDVFFLGEIPMLVKCW